MTSSSAGHQSRSSTPSIEAPDDLPAWLRPLAEAAGQLTWGQLSRFRPPPDAEPRPASVLLLFGDEDGEPSVLLLERAHDMRSHAGQVAFPGGSQDPDDADEVAAALREANEETGLDPAGVEVIGILPTLWLPPSNFAVTPVLGWWRTPCEISAVDPAETASVHTIAISELVDPDNRVTVRHPSGMQGPAFLVRDLVIWGFTAGVLSRLFGILGWDRPWDDSHVIDLPQTLASSSQRDLERAVAAGHLPASGFASSSGEDRT